MGQKMINADGAGLCNEAIGSQFKCSYSTYKKKARETTNSVTIPDYPTNIHVQVEDDTATTNYQLG
jgi:hypothetical protein